MTLRKMSGGPYMTSCVFDIAQYVTPYSNRLLTIVGSGGIAYIDSLVAFSLWQAGIGTNVLCPKGFLGTPEMTGEIRLIVNELIRALEAVVYKAFFSLQCTDKGIVMLRPDALFYRRGEVWLCWKTYDLY